MRTLRPIIVLLIAGAVATIARGGHEVPVYPSYYPHEIEIKTSTPEQAGNLLLEGKMHAYVGAAPRFANAPPDWIRSVESLGAFITVHVNPASSLAADAASACGVAPMMLRDMAGRSGEFVFHPYPVTPFHGDYLYHADLVDGARARTLAAPAGPPSDRPLKVKASGALAERLVRPEWRAQDADWDVAIEEAAVVDLVAPSMHMLDGWFSPPWIRAGWFHAHLLLGDPADDGEDALRARNDVRRLEAGEYANAAERVNLERDVVRALNAGCRHMVAGYTVKREYFNAEFSAGIENVAHDSLTGLNSGMFIRTAKLKDFPWNGWLALGIDGRPQAAWNPVAGFTDAFGRLLWSALGDPAVLPAPNDARWTINRIADVQSSSGK
jgi:hypothetical protein